MKLFKGQHKEVLAQLEKDTFTIEQAKNTLASYLESFKAFSKKYTLLEVASTLLLVLSVYGNTHSNVSNSTYGIFINLVPTFLFVVALVLELYTEVRKNHLKEVVLTYEKWIFKKENGTELEGSELIQEKGSVAKLIFHIIGLIIIIALSFSYFFNLPI